MFDGLKDKLSGFTSDVEEDVDEEAVEEDVEDDAAEAEAADEDAVAAESEPETAAEDTGDESPAEAESADSDDAAEADAAEAETVDDIAEADTETVSETDEVDGEAADEAVEADTDSDDGGAAKADAPADDEADADTDDVPSLAPDDEEDGDDGGRSFTEKAKIMATGKTVIEEEDLQNHLDDLELALLSSDVEMSVANEILSGVEENLTGETRRRLSSTGNLVRDALREALFDVISVGQFDFDERVQTADKPVVIIFTGVNGVGKTTTIAKLSQYFEDRGLSTVLANGDTYRAGANEQLEKHAQNLGKKIITHEQGSDPTAVVYDAVEYAKANDVDVVLGDTAGRLHTSDDLMAQLAKIDRNIDPDMTLFVDEAVAGQDAVNRAREFDDAAEIDGAILTKADADPQGGAAISVAHVTGKPILFLGTGQGYDDLESFDPEAIVDSLFDE
ncbi:signal recognition particle-docking protein FtsY [Halomicroarcula sp. F28]|uniref:signal recognition particle-docking protein FtsY n=1 Tax=Haloarcula salinisoli TaxID=2487746 RepID=UPI001C72FFE5|nr:signal recognition particle-docking protein FtsY [Halomicroarcula salinisoli]MBX0287682.1 signal recognition particle-docking protein FtsY [Halomicroarcula salinisoli]